MPATATAQPGDVFVRSWGYDQTQVDYYEIVEVSASGKTAKARKLKTAVADSAGQGERVTAATGPDRFADNPACSRCGSRHPGEAGWDGHAFSDRYSWQARFDRVTVNRHGDHAYRWDGKPDYQTAFGWGH
jgi:hypothetical protein